MAHEILTAFGCALEAQQGVLSDRSFNIKKYIEFPKIFLFPTAQRICNFFEFQNDDENESLSHFDVMVSYFFLDVAF
jgi:hypothetical protein